jgi:endonuclease YncB( thermonuclease family)
MRFAEHMKKASLVGAFFVSVVWHLQAQALCPAGQRVPQVEVAKVIDGDTLRLVDGRSVRLIGLNATETAHKARKAEPFSQAAKARLQALIGENDGRVGLRAGQQSRDRYGRVLAHLFDVHGQSVEAQMLAEGMGFHVAINPNVSMSRCLQAAEQQARLARKGLWRQSPVVAPDQLRHGGFAVVRAHVERLDANRGGVWLELRGSLVLQIPQEIVGAFGDSLKELPGKDVEVRGWVIDRKGRADSRRHARWMLRITHPTMLVPLS